MFAFIFDMLSLEFAFESEKYSNLEYNDDYIEKINKILDDEIYEIEDNKNKKKTKDCGLELSSNKNESVTIADGCAVCEDGKNKKNQKQSYGEIKNIDEFKNKISKIPVGERLTPSILGMPDRYLFYHWINKVDGVEKINGQYMRVA